MISPLSIYRIQRRRVLMMGMMMIDTIRMPMNRTPSVVPGTVRSPSWGRTGRRWLIKAVTRSEVRREAKKSSMGLLQYNMSSVPSGRNAFHIFKCDFYLGIQGEIYYNCAAYHMNRRYGIVILAARVEFTYNLTLGILHKVSTLETL